MTRRGPEGIRRVRVRVDAAAHPVRIGDLLVTSDKNGLAMVSEPVDLGGVKMHRPGTVIGKALEPLAGGEGGERRRDGPDGDSLRRLSAVR